MKNSKTGRGNRAAKPSIQQQREITKHTIAIQKAVAKKRLLENLLCFTVGKRKMASTVARRSPANWKPFAGAEVSACREVMRALHAMYMETRDAGKGSR